MDLLVATTNQGKLREYVALLGELPVRILSLSDVGLGGMDVDETAETFAGNAVLKAQTYAQASGLPSLADDSGLEVDALDGKPGVYSHRYAGPKADDRARYEKLLRELAHVPDDQRTARFVCVIALADPADPTPVTTLGTVEGYIAHEPDLSGGGFGYDPVFVPDGSPVAWSALPLDVKNGLSHRGNALRKMVPILRERAK